MTETIKDADLKDNAVVPPADTTKKPEDNKSEAPQDPLKPELDKIKDKKEGRTLKEKLIYTKNRVERQLRELEGEEDIDNLPEDDDDAPVTVGMLKQREQEKATKTALQLADDIENETERELVKHHIENTVKPSGNPALDLSNARAIVNAAKNAKIAEELARKGKPKDHSSGSSAPANKEGQEEELTADELAFTRPPFNMSKADIIKTRK